MLIITFMKILTNVLTLDVDLIAAYMIVAL